MSAGQLTAQRHSNMSENRSLHDAQDCGGTPKHRSVCDKWLVGLVLLTLARASEALAGEQFVIPEEAPHPDLGTARQPLDLALQAQTSRAMQTRIDVYQPSPVPATQSYSSAEFRPRGRSVFDTEPRGVPLDAPMLQGTTVWQRLSDYRSRDRVRLLTLWETGGSSLSLQAGRKGSPSLQWTSRLMNRGGATRGVLDKVFEASVANAATRLHLAPRPPAGELLTKPSKLAEGAQEK